MNLIDAITDVISHRKYWPQLYIIETPDGFYASNVPHYPPGVVVYEDNGTDDFLEIGQKVRNRRAEVKENP